MSLLLLSPRFWLVIGIAAVLGLTHITVYRKGKANVQLEWRASVSAANEEARRLEQARQRRADEAAGLAAARQASNLAAAARVAGERDGLQNALNLARERGAQSLHACRDHSAALEAVFGECRGRLEEVGRDAAGHASDSLTLQQAWPQ